jgi:hypothetical protein
MVTHQQAAVNTVLDQYSCPSGEAVKRYCPDTNLEMVSKRVRLEEICKRVEEQLKAAALITAEPGSSKTITNLNLL